MRSSHSLDRLDTAFDDDRLVADAGLVLPATLAQHLGLKALVDEHLDLGAATGRANVGDKFLTLVISALAGGDCIDDTNALRAGGTGRVLGFRVKAASTLGTFLPGQPGAPRPCLGRGCRTGGRTADDRPRLDDLRDPWAQEGGSEAPRLHRRARLPSAAGGRGRDRGGAHGEATRGTGQHRPRSRSLPHRDHRPRPPRGRHRAAHDARRQRLLRPCRGGGVPGHGCPLQHHRAPAPLHPGAHRGHR